MHIRTVNELRVLKSGTERGSKVYCKMACRVGIQTLLFTKMSYSISFPSDKQLPKSGNVMPTLGHS